MNRKRAVAQSANKIVMGYLVISILTLPFMNRWWIGELPVFAVVQLPKIFAAQTITRHVLMPLLRLAGLSSGNFSPDYRVVSPFGLLAVYLVLGLVVVFYTVMRRETLRTRSGWYVIGAAICLFCIDCAFTLLYRQQPGMTIF